MSHTNITTIKQGVRHGKQIPYTIYFVARRGEQPAQLSNP